jgi:hypothetical protein
MLINNPDPMTVINVPSQEPLDIPVMFRKFKTLALFTIPLMARPKAKIDPERIEKRVFRSHGISVPSCTGVVSFFGACVGVDDRKIMGRQRAETRTTKDVPIEDEVSVIPVTGTSVRK